jgi:hypothetical protein
MREIYERFAHMVLVIEGDPAKYDEHAPDV